MPESYGKRQKDTKKAKKFAAREERRATRKQQKADEAAGIFHPPADLGTEETPGLEPDPGAPSEGPAEPAADTGE